MAVAAKSLFEAPLDRPALAKGIFFERSWHFGQDIIWSSDTDASINVVAETFPEPVALVMTFGVFNASEDSPKTLLVESTGHEVIELVVTTAAPCSVVVKTPVHQSGAQYSPIYMRLDSLDSPAKLGQTSDDRLLGLHIHLLSPETPVLSFPLDFTDPKTCETVLREGWAPPEPETGTWSLGGHARLVLPGYLFPPQGTKLLVNATALPRPDEFEPLEIDIESDGRKLAAWGPSWGADKSSETDSAWTCQMPPVSPLAHRELTLTIRGALPPAMLGINSDSRELGLLLQKITVTD